MVSSREIMTLRLLTWTGQAPARRLCPGVWPRSVGPLGLFGQDGAEPPSHPKLPWPTLPIKTRVTGDSPAGEAPFVSPAP